MNIMLKKLRNAAIISAILVAGVSGNAMAVDCGPYQIDNIQVQTTDVLVAVRSGSSTVWKSLGLLSSAATKSYLAIAMQAFAMNRTVILRFADPHTCGTTNYSTMPQMIRINN